MNLEKEYKATMIGPQMYMTNKDDMQIQATFMRLEQQMTRPMIMARQPLGRPNS